MSADDAVAIGMAVLAGGIGILLICAGVCGVIQAIRDRDDT